MNWSVRPHMSPHLLQPPRCSTSGNSEVSTTDSAAGCGMNWTVRRPRGRRKRHGRRGGNMAKVAQNETKKRTFPLPFSLFSLSSIALSPAPKICRQRLLKYDGESFQRIALAFILYPLKTPSLELAVKLFRLKTQDLRLKTLKTLTNREPYQIWRIKDLIWTIIYIRGYRTNSFERAPYLPL